VRTCGRAIEMIEMIDYDDKSLFDNEHFLPADILGR
jgi:hypothetical protein